MHQLTINQEKREPNNYRLSITR